MPMQRRRFEAVFGSQPVLARFGKRHLGRMHVCAPGDVAAHRNDLRVPPGNRLKKPGGTRAGQYSIRINDQWRISFTWSAGGAGNVELVDYQ